MRNDDTIWEEHGCVEKIYSIVDDVLRNKTYSNNEINKWSNIICEESMSFLYSKMLPLKYIISCYILKSANTETSLRFSTYWDKEDSRIFNEKKKKKKKKKEGRKEMRMYDDFKKL
ncbi:conserved Plasmodium protein, unknown function [Plasmodium ovale curtisi]|uniref:Dynein light chain Tctex-type n=1 Tax=Plasmodium ovale curtisi TaxID=864141 RepID=A0A1A8WHN9_PLAOA|nr:conserved Plasmodium protein, unknown function [Plasmodium ovale curtisi]